MNRLWNTIIRPIIEGVKAQNIVEIGSDTGINTKNILEYCLDHDLHLIAIDPSPNFDIEEFKIKYGDKFEFYQELSLNRLPLIKDFDAILIDGDHNWYTVYNELKIIEEKFNKKNFPIIFLHDVGWPYARRDLYYNPKNIPESFRHPYNKLGMSPGEECLKENGGLNVGLYNSIYENNPKNGVLTAVEDFINESKLELTFKTINVFFGLGILYMKNKKIDEIVERVSSDPKLLDLVEEELIKITISNSEKFSHNIELQNELNKKVTYIEDLENTLNTFGSRLEETEILANVNNEELLQTKNKLESLKEHVAYLEDNQHDEKLYNKLEDVETTIIEMKYYDNYGRSLLQRLSSKFTTLYILFKPDNIGIKNKIINIKGYRAIKKNNLFNIGYYLKNNTDLRLTGKDPFIHYLYHGYKENRNPSPDFDNDYYTSTTIEVQKTKINPLIHYSLYGINEGKRTLDPAIENKKTKKRIPFIKRKSLEEIYGVSVIMPTYNRADIIERAIDSVLDQNYNNFELLIIDDGSSDNTEAMVKEKYENFLETGKIKYFKQENKGVHNARNNGLSRAKGNIIAYLDSDNYWLDTYLEKMVSALSDNNRNTAYSALDVDDKFRNRKFIREIKYTRKELLRVNFIDLNIFVHKKFLYDQLGGFSESLERLVDWDLIIRYTRLNEPYFVDQVLAKYFLSEKLNNISNTVDLGENRLKVIKNHSDEYIAKGIINLNIAYVLWDFPTFSQTFVMNELKWLVENNYDVKVFYKIEPDLKAEIDFDIEAIKIKNVNDLVSKLEEYDINIMHTHFAYPTCTELTYPAAIKTGIPFTLSAHAVDIFHKKNDKRNKIGEIGRSEYCKKIFVPGKFHQNYLIERGVPNEKLMSLRQATKYEITNSLTMESPRFDRKIRNVITIARFIEKKGIDTLIESAKILEKEDLIFKIYGYGPLEKELKNQIKKLKLENVVFEGTLKGHEELKKAYQEGDIIALPCRRASNGDMDGVPTVLFEAMGYSIPIITTNVSSIPEFILNDYYGFIVNPDDPKALAETIMKVKNLKKDDLYTVLKRAQNHVKEISSIDETIKTMLDIWKTYRIDIFMVTDQRDESKDLETTKEILDRIYKYTTINFDLTIIDNNSDDEFINFIKDYSLLHPNIRLILLNENVTLAAASNIALERFNNEFAIHINSNEGCILRKGWEYKAINFMREHENVALAGTFEYFQNPDETTDIPQDFFKDFRNREYLENKDVVKFKYIHGGIYILKKEAYNKCGGFNTSIPQNCINLEYSCYLKTNNWELDEITEWISINRKTLPNVNTFLDEYTTAAYPLVFDELNQIEDQGYTVCNICNGQITGDKCNICGSDSSERALYRIIGMSSKINNSLTCTLLLKNNTLHKQLNKMFNIINNEYSTKNILEEEIINNLDNTDVLISNIKLNKDNAEIIINSLNKDGMLVLELSNNEKSNDIIKNLLELNRFKFKSVEFISTNLTNKELIIAERSL